MAVPVLAGIGAGAGGAAVAAPALAAAATTIAASAAVAAVYKKTCEWMIEIHQQDNCRDAGWLDLNCATIRTLALGNCGILAGAVGTMIVASGGILNEYTKPYVDTIAKFANSGIKNRKNQ